MSKSGEGPALTGDTDAAVAFLQALHPDGPWHICAIDPDGPLTARTFAHDDVERMRESIDEWQGKANVYVHVNRLRDGMCDAKAKKTDVASVWFAHVDIDDTDALSRLLDFELQPTAIVFSGGGFNAYWRFGEPIADIERAERINRWLVGQLDGDRAVTDVSRILRVPGTINLPTKKKRERGRAAVVAYLVTERSDWNRSFDPASFGESEAAIRDVANAADILPAEKIDLADLAALDVPDEILKILRDGRNADWPKKQDNSRSAWLFHAVCSLLRCDVPEDVVLSIILDPKYKISESVIEKGKRARAYAERQIKRAQAERADTLLEAMNREHAVVEDYGSRTVVFTFRPDGTVFHRSFEDFRKSYDNRKVEAEGRGGKPALKGIGSYFIDHRHRRQYRTVEFLPGLEAPEGVLNLYRGSSIRAADGDCSRFSRFIDEVICAGNEEVSEWLLDYIAHLFQKPWEPPEACIVLRGRQGVGKNFFVERVGEIIADYFLTVTNPKHLIGSFNRHLMDKLMVFADETFYGGAKSGAGILKNLVTQSQMAIEPKGVDVFMAKKYFRLVMASNEVWVVPTDIDDRRYLVLDVSPDRAKDHAYFAEIGEEWKDGGREGFYKAMLERDISGFNHRLRPETAALYDQKLRSLLGAERVVYEILTAGEAPLLLKRDGRYFISTDELRRAHNQRGKDVSGRALALELDLIADHEGSVREGIGGRQARGFWVPELTECRRVWAAAKRLKIDWPEDDGEWIDTRFEYPI